MPLFSHPGGRTLRNLSGLLMGSIPLRSLGTGATGPSLLRTPCANPNHRGRQKKPPPSAYQKTPWYTSSRINTLLSTSRLSRITSFDHTYVPTLASKPALAASLSAPTARASYELQPANTSMGGSGTGPQVYYQYGWHRTWSRSSASSLSSLMLDCLPCSFQTS